MSLHIEQRMPQKRNRPRRSICVSAEVDEALRRASFATGASYSSLIDQFLQPAVPTLLRLAAAVELAKSGDPTAFAEMAEAMSSIQNQLNEVTDDVADAKAVLEKAEQDYRDKGE